MHKFSLVIVYVNACDFIVDVYMHVLVFFSSSSYVEHLEIGVVYYDVASSLFWVLTA